MQFDLSDVEPVPQRRSRPTTEVIPIDEDDMLEAACLLPPVRTATGTLPPPGPTDRDARSRPR
jgi:hypothetical protein